MRVALGGDWMRVDFNNARRFRSLAAQFHEPFKSSAQHAYTSLGHDIMKFISAHKNSRSVIDKTPTLADCE